MPDINVKFLRGQQGGIAQLLTNKNNIQDGAFYLTEDTNRLYVGKTVGGQKDLALLNQTVQIVDRISTLEATSNGWTSAEQKASHVNDLYYCVSENVLAVWKADTNGTNYSWQQINKNTDTNTVLSKANAVVEAAADGATVQLTITDSAGATFGAGVGEDDASFTIKAGTNAAGAKAANVAIADGAVVIKGDTYSLSSEAKSGGGATIKLASELGQAGSNVNIVGGNNVTVSQGASGITIESENWKPKAQTGEITLSNANGVLSIDIVGNDDLTYSGSSSQLGMTIGSGVTTFVPLGGAMDVYTVAQVDDKFKNLNGLTYCGTISKSSSDVVSTVYATNDGDVKDGKDAGAQNVVLHNGDMFMVSEADITVTGLTGAIGVGDLIICTGEENEDGIVETPVWTLVPSGDHTTPDTLYSFTPNSAENKITLYGSNGGGAADAGSFALTAGKDVAISSVASGTGLVSTVNHRTIPTTAGTDNGDLTVGNDSLETYIPSSFSAITGVTVDNGHVTGTTTTTYNLPKYKSDIGVSFTQVEGSPDKVTVTNSFTTAINGSETIGQSSFSITSNSLKLTADAATQKVELDLVWGAF